MKFYTELRQIDIYTILTMKRRNANWIGHFLRRNCLLKHVIEEKTEAQVEVMGRRGRRRKWLLDDLN
jgi:hypothetical protein